MKTGTLFAQSAFGPFTRSVMRKIGIVSILLSGLFTIAPLVGCESQPAPDKVVNATEKTTTDRNGNASTVQQKTVEHPDGSVTTEKKVDSQRNP
jgi:hypothetical protein